MSSWAGLVGVLVDAWRRWYGPPAPDDRLVIRPPVQKFGKLPQPDIDALRAKAEQRRLIATERYRRGSRDDVA
jgi:hypothetical protein